MSTMITTITAADTTMAMAEQPFPSGGFWGPFWCVGLAVIAVMVGLAAYGNTNGVISFTFSFIGRFLGGAVLWTGIWLFLLFLGIMGSLILGAFEQDTANNSAPPPVESSVSCSDTAADCGDEYAEAAVW